MYLDQTEGCRFHVHTGRSKEEIGKPDRINGKLRLKGRGNLIIPNFSDRARFPAEIDCINKKNLISIFEERQKIEPQGPSINDLDNGTEMTSFLQDTDDVNTDPGNILAKKLIQFYNSPNIYVM